MFLRDTRDGTASPHPPCFDLYAEWFKRGKYGCRNEVVFVEFTYYYSRLESFQPVSTCFFFLNVNYETNLFKELCGVTPVFLVSRFSMLYSLRWLSVSFWQTLVVLPAKDTVIFAGCYISITLTAGWRIF